MQRTLSLLFAITLVGCSDPMDNPIDDPGVNGEGTDSVGRTPVQSMSGSQSGSEDILVCIEAERTAVTDPTAIPQGAVISAQGYVDALAAEWTGELVPTPGGSPQPLSVSLDADLSTLDFVIYADEGWEPTDPVPYGADDGCQDQYEVDVVMHVTSGAELDELVAVQARGWSDYTYLFVPAEVDDADVTGTLTPTAFDLSTAPDPWLLLSLNQTSSSTHFHVAWFDDIAEEDTDNPIIEDFGSITLSQ